MTNAGLHPMEVQWAIEKIKDHQPPEIHSNDEGDIITIMVGTYLDYRNGLVDSEGESMFFINQEAREMSVKSVYFKAQKYADGPARHNWWMEWVLA